jgi:hypothetical protein
MLSEGNWDIDCEKQYQQPGGNVSAWLTAVNLAA